MALAGRIRTAPFVGLIAGTIGALFVFLLVRTPYLYDTDGLTDDLFVLNSAWAVLHGFRPIVDFPDRYGGLLSRIVAWCFAWNGASVKALDHALAIIYLIDIAMLLVVARHRLSPSVFLMALLVITAVTLTRSPLEQPFDLSRGSHGTIYNRMAWAWMFIAFIVAILPVRRGSDLPGIVVAAIATIAMALVKMSFLVAVPAIGVAFVLGRRVEAAVLWIGGMVVALLALWLAWGVGPGEWLRIAHDMASAADPSRSSGLARKAVYIALYNSLPLLAVLWVLGAELLSDWRRAWPVAVAASLFLLVGVAAAVSTGLAIYIEATVPAAAMAAVIVGESLWRRHALHPRHWFPLLAAIGVLVFPHLANAVRCALHERDYGLRFEQSAAMRDMLVVVGRGQVPIVRPLGAQRGWVEARLRANSTFYALTDQEKVLVLEDGLATIRGIVDYRALGMLTPGARMFPYMLGAKPVTSFGFWMEEHEVGRHRPLPADVDLVAVLRGKMQDLDRAAFYLVEAARTDFILCRQGAFWDVYLRRSGDGRRSLGSCDAARDPEKVELAVTYSAG